MLVYKKVAEALTYGASSIDKLGDLIDILGMPKEYDGFVPTGQESTFVVSRALDVYLQYAFAVQVSEIFKDDFDDGFFAGWTKMGESCTESSGVLTGTNGFKARAGVGDFYLQNLNYEFNIKVKTTSYKTENNGDVPWLLFRYTDENNYDCVLWHRNGYLEVSRYKGGSKTTLFYRSIGYSPSLNIWYNWQIEVRGWRIIIKIDGDLVADFYDTNENQWGSWGMYSCGCDAQYDEVWVYPQKYTKTNLDDNFDDGDYMGWEAISGTWTVSNGKLTSTGTNSKLIHHGGSNNWDLYEWTFTGRALTTGSDAASVPWYFFNYQNDSFCYYFRLRKDRELQLVQVWNGNPSVLVSKNINELPDAAHTFKVKVSPHIGVTWSTPITKKLRIQIWVDGTEHVDYNDTFYDSTSKGRIGFYTYDSTGEFDNVQVTRPDYDIVTDPDYTQNHWNKHWYPFKPIWNDDPENDWWIMNFSYSDSHWKAYLHDDDNDDYSDIVFAQGRKVHEAGYYTYQLPYEPVFLYDPDDHNMASADCLTLTVKFRINGPPTWLCSPYWPPRIPPRGPFNTGSLVAMVFWEFQTSQGLWADFSAVDPWGDPDLLVTEKFNRWFYDPALGLLGLPLWYQASDLNPFANFPAGWWWPTTHDRDYHWIGAGWRFEADEYGTFKTFTWDVTADLKRICDTVYSQYRSGLPPHWFIVKARIKAVMVSIETYCCEHTGYCAYAQLTYKSNNN